MYAEVLITKKAKRWSVVEHVLIGFTFEQKTKHRTAQRLLETVVNSWEFRQELLGMKLTSTKGMSNAKIYELILNGSEVLSPEIDNEADISVHAYNEHRIKGKVIGYTLPDTETTWINLYFFDGFSYDEIACNLFHEWLHKLGFTHTSANEKTSVPYALGYLIKRLVKDLMKGVELHDVSEADAEIGVILESNIPSTPISQELVCTRSWRNIFRKVCHYV